MHASDLCQVRGGTDSQPYSSVQQSDIDNAANQLISANTPNAQRVVQGLVKPSERLIGTSHCSPSKPRANHSAGDRASQVTVTVSFTCSGEVYAYEGALTLAQTLLKQHVQQLYPNTPFSLVGNITTTMRQQPTLTTSSGTVTMTIDVSGTWIAQFDTKRELAIAQAIAGKTRAAAQALLKTQPGIKTSSIYLQGGNILPTNANQIDCMIGSAWEKLQ